jgi:hypothetical protein
VGSWAAAHGRPERSPSRSTSRHELTVVGGLPDETVEATVDDDGTTPLVRVVSRG